MCQLVFYCELSTLKTITITYNLLMVVCGVALIFIGISVSKEAGDFSDIIEDRRPFIVQFFLISTGLVFIGSRFLGVLGLWLSKKKIIYLYGFMSVLLHICLVSIAMTVLSHNDEIAESGSKKIQDYFRGSDRNDSVIHKIQSTYACCGDDSPQYWDKRNEKLPDSCCSDGRCDILSSLLIGCAFRFEEIVKSSAAVIVWTSFGVSVAALIGFCLTFFICTHLNHTPEEDTSKEMTNV